MHAAYVRPGGVALVSFYTIPPLTLGLSRFRHGSVWFGSGNKTSVLGFFRFGFILCNKNGITQ